MDTIFQIMGLRTRVQVNENERALHLYKGEIAGLLMPGEYLLVSDKNRLTVERHDLSRPEFVSPYEKALFEKCPQEAERHLTVLRTGAGEVAIVERDGRLHTVLGPDARLVVWADAGPWTHTTIDVSEMPQVEPVVLRRLGAARMVDHLSLVTVADGQAGLMFVDGAYDRKLGPGAHAFWTPDRAVQFKLVDLKWQAVDVTGQEVLTRDRVTIRINLTADYRVTDPVKAVSEVKNFADALYRALQYAFRKTLGVLTLDAILEQKVNIDEQAAEKVRTDMAAIGIEVGEITLKDIILPGDMREILNTVVAAQKEAEANVIRRREETNATRSLLNTAKVMADNPVMLRLKELEALETIAERVDRLTIHNGADGLMNDLVRLKADD